MNKYYKSSCPVPKDQRPLNQYLELSDSIFFNWFLLDNHTKFNRIFSLFTLSFLSCLPITNSFYSINEYPFLFIFLNFIFVLCIMLFFLIRILLSWQYIKERLYNVKVFYEESGWYDGKIWIKPKNIIRQDRLIINYQIDPMLSNLRSFLLLIGIFLTSLIIILIVID